MQYALPGPCAKNKQQSNTFTSTYFSVKLISIILSINLQGKRKHLQDLIKIVKQGFNLYLRENAEYLTSEQINFFNFHMNENIVTKLSAVLHCFI